MDICEQAQHGQPTTPSPGFKGTPELHATRHDCDSLNDTPVNDIPLSDSDQTSTSSSIASWNENDGVTLQQIRRRDARYPSLPLCWRDGCLSNPEQASTGIFLRGVP